MFNAKAEPVSKSGFFTASIADGDPEVADAIGKELGRQQHEIELIASENIVSKAVLEAAGSVLTNKYAEGYPGQRYYGGCQYVDIVEQLAIDRAKKLFGCGFANVQPNSGSQANQGVFNALATARRHDPRPQPRRRRPSDARRARQPVGQVVQAGVLHGASRHAPRRHGRGLQARPRAQPAHHHRRRLGLSAPVRLRRLPRHRRRGRRVSDGRHGALRRSRRRRRSIRARSRTPTSSPRRRTRRCAARAAA